MKYCKKVSLTVTDNYNTLKEPSSSSVLQFFTLIFVFYVYNYAFKRKCNISGYYCNSWTMQLKSGTTIHLVIATHVTDAH